MKRALFVMAALAGCSSAACSSGEGPSASTTSASAAPSAAPARESADKPARDVLQRWLAAQNGNDFAGYQALYAAKFEGVKRAGPRTQRFARDGWMADRKAMFDKKATVEASEVAVFASSNSARIRFVQSFSSGTFQDRGPKEIVVVKDGSGWKIAREEMLSSTLQPPLKAIGGEHFAFVVHSPGARVVLDALPDAAWGKGAPRLLEDGSPVVTEVSVDEARLPKGLAAWRDRPLRLFGEAGEVCQAVVTGFSLVGRVEPHFGTRALWRGKPEEAGIVLDGPPEQPWSRAAIAQNAFEMAAGGQLLVANLKLQSGQCGKALWARGASLPVPKIAAAEAPPPAVEKRALEAFRALPAYQAIADDHRKHGGTSAHWDEHDGAKPNVRQLRVAGGSTFVAVKAEAGAGCGDFGGTLFALFEMQGDRMVLANDPADGAVPLSAVDVDGDGKVELIANESLRRAKGALWDQVDSLTVPFLDCGC